MMVYLSINKDTFGHRESGKWGREISKHCVPAAPAVAIKGGQLVEPAALLAEALLLSIHLHLHRHRGCVSGSGRPAAWRMPWALDVEANVRFQGRHQVSLTCWLVTLASRALQFCGIAHGPRKIRLAGRGRKCCFSTPGTKGWRSVSHLWLFAMVAAAAVAPKEGLLPVQQLVAPVHLDSSGQWTTCVRTSSNGM